LPAAPAFVENARQNAERVGYTGHWVIARGASKLALRRLRLQPVAEECAPGWRYAYGNGSLHDLAALVLRAASAGDGVAAGASVHDSDYAEVVAVGGGLVAKLAIRPERAVGHLPHDPDAFAHWTWGTPRPLTAAEAQAIAEEGDALAEATVEELFDQLGLPAPYDPLAPHGLTGNVLISIGKAPRVAPGATKETIGATELGGYLAPLGFMADVPGVDGRRTDWQGARYVPGLGRGFLGIWDRESPGEPVATFVVSRRGEARLLDELERLQPGSRGEASRDAWYGRFDRVDGKETVSGTRLASAVFEDDDVTGVVVAAEHGHEGEPAAYLVRPGDGIRHVYSLDSLEALTAMLERYLGEVELSEWITLPVDAPPDLRGLGAVVLTLVGL
jgi:hypothetical protein